MPYIGTSPSNGVRRIHTYTATASQTTFTGASSEGVTLSYADTNYIDVFQNGVLLGSADYTSTSGTSVVLAQGASADDLIVIVVYDVFSVADTVSKTNGGSFDSAVTMSGGISGNTSISGDLTIPDKIIHDGDTNTSIRFPSADTVSFETSGSERMRVDSTGALQIGGTTNAGFIDFDSTNLQLNTQRNPNTGAFVNTGKSHASIVLRGDDGDSHIKFATTSSNNTASTERMRIDSGGNVLFSTTGTPNSVSDANNTSATGMAYESEGFLAIARAGATFIANRIDSDGSVILIKQEGDVEGTISVSGSTVSFNGGHLARWSRLLDNSKDTTIVKGTVMTNLDEMVEWSHEEVLWTDEDELPDGVSVGDVKKPAYTEDNEQLNKMAISSVEGDINVAGVFVSWDNDDDFNDMNIAMTGDMVIRIAKATTVARGDLLMSAGDGTAKPQDDDIVRSKTIAKVTSTNVSHTYDDGTYLVPCVVMAC